MYEELHVGDAAEMAKTVTEVDLTRFAGVTGDFNSQSLRFTKPVRIGDTIIEGRYSR